MNKMHEIKEHLNKELDTFAGKNMSRADLETVHLLTDTIKNICKIDSMHEDGYSNNYSRDGNWEARGGYSRTMGHSYGDDYSNGMHYVRGHYSREDGRQQLMDNIDMAMRDESLSVDERDALRRARSAMTRR